MCTYSPSQLPEQDASLRVRPIVWKRVRVDAAAAAAAAVVRPLTTPPPATIRTGAGVAQRGTVQSKVTVRTGHSASGNTTRERTKGVIKWAQ